MADVDPLATQRDLVPDTPADLAQAGFDHVEEIGHGGFGVVYRQSNLCGRQVREGGARSVQSRHCGRRLWLCHCRR
jgi:hypothetical protein